MREQIQVPNESGTGSSKDQEDTWTRGFNRPLIPKGLKKVKERVVTGYRCKCGARGKSVCNPVETFYED